MFQSGGNSPLEALMKQDNENRLQIKPTALPRDLTIIVGPPGPEEDRKMIEECAARKGVKPEDMYVEYIHTLFKGASKIADGETQSSFDKFLSSFVGQDVRVMDIFPTYTILKGQLLPVFIIDTKDIVDAAGMPSRIDLGNSELRDFLSSILGLSFRSEWIRTFVSYFDELDSQKFWFSPNASFSGKVFNCVRLS